MKEELYNKIDKFCNETDWSKYPTYEHALEDFIKGIVAEETKELEKENADLESNFRICEKNADTYYDNLTRATEIIEGLMRFCRCFAQHHTEDIRYKDAEQFLNSEVEK